MFYTQKRHERHQVADTGAIQIAIIIIIIIITCNQHVITWITVFIWVVVINKHGTTQFLEPRHCWQNMNWLCFYFPQRSHLVFLEYDRKHMCVWATCLDGRGARIFNILYSCRSAFINDNNVPWGCRVILSTPPFLFV